MLQFGSRYQYAASLTVTQQGCSLFRAAAANPPIPTASGAQVVTAVWKAPRPRGGNPCLARSIPEGLGARCVTARPVERGDMRRLFSVVLGVIMLALVAAPADAGDRNFVAQLSARTEVPSNESLAQGQAIFHLSADGAQLDYRLITANIDNVVVAQIHIAPTGVNGPVVAFLFGPVAAGAEASPACSPRAR
jgi:CHRD domain